MYLPPYYQHHKSDLGEAQILEDVRKGNLYRMVEVDIEVPECLWEHFSEMSPLFCTYAVPFEVIGEKMQAHVEKYNMDKRPRKLQVGGMKAKKLLLLTCLLKWYLDHGLHVTKIYQMIEFSPQSCSASPEKASQMPKEKGMRIQRNCFRVTP